jgi:hypothetical protein
MAATFTPDKAGDSATLVALGGGLWILFGTVTFTGSYATNGDTLGLKKYLRGVSTTKQIIPLGSFRGNSGEYDVVNDKLKLNSAANTEISAGAYNAALTATPVPCAFLCK